MSRLKDFFRKRRRSNSPLQRQMNVVYTLALLIPLTIGGVFLVSQTQSLQQSHYIALLETNNQRVRSVLSDIARQAYTLSSEVCFNKNIKQILLQEHEDSSAFISAVNQYDNLDDVSYNTEEFANIMIYTDNPTVLEYREFYRITSDIVASDWYQKSADTTKAFWTSIDQASYSGTKNNLCLVRRISLGDCDYSAVLVIRVSDSYIRSRVSSGSIIDVISVDDAGVVYSSQRNLYGRQQVVDIDYDTDIYRNSGVVDVNGVKYFSAVSTTSLYMTGSKMYICTLDKSGFSDIQRITFSWTMILVLALFVSLVVLSVFSRRFTKRVQCLRLEMHKARQQDYNLSADFGGNDELTEAYEDLKAMVQGIKEKDSQMYEAQLNEKELRNKQQSMEFKMLSAQINPHYLYNTLETIRMKALAGGNREVADSIKILGKTLHYVLENTGITMTTLRKELDHVENYLAIQRLRFGERINYEIIIAPNIDPVSYTILPLLLQPVVENAVVHGLETVSGMGVIRIEISICQGVLQIVIADSGSGMSREQLQSVQDGLNAEQMPRSSIALYNIHQRIRLRYGEEYGVSVDSHPGEGTQVCLKLPAESQKNAL